MPSSAITWRLLTPSTSTLRRISIQRSISVNTPSSRYESSALRNYIVLDGLGGVALFDRRFRTSQTVTLFDRRLHLPSMTAFCASRNTPGKQGQRLTDDQVKALEKFSPEFRERHIETRYTGELVAVDTFFVGVLKGVGRVYMQSVMDCFSRYAWGRLYTSKLPVTAVHILNEDVLPFFESHQARIVHILSDNGREFCGRMDQHDYELFLQLEGIKHKTTKVRRPQSNGYVERFHKTILDEHFRIQGRSKWYESVEQMQADLDAYLVIYNSQRPHQGRNMNGRTPLTVFKEGLKLVPAKIENPDEEALQTAI